MAGKVTTLFEDSAKTSPLFPRTKTTAVSDADNHPLGNLAVYNAETVISGIDSIDLRIDMDLLWTNSSIASSFSPQTVSLDLSSYRAIAIEFVSWNSSSAHNAPLKIFTVPTTPANSGSKILVSIDYYDYFVGRNITQISTTGIVFGDGMARNGSANGYGIPYKIYGIK